MKREEIENSIKIEILQERIEDINKNLIGKKEYFILEEENGNTFNYTLKVQDKQTKRILSTRGFIGKIEVLEYICGFEKAMQLFI